MVKNPFLMRENDYEKNKKSICHVEWSEEFLQNPKSIDIPLNIF
jgi:hypothetical protein